MEQVIKYKASNGTLFDTKEQCVKYENVAQLQLHISEYCEHYYCEDMRTSVKEDSMIADYILTHFEDIKNIINK